jgi:hypothetical protein
VAFGPGPRLEDLSWAYIRSFLKKAYCLDKCLRRTEIENPNLLGLRVPTPVGHLKRLVREELTARWVEEWGEGSGKQYSKFVEPRFSVNLRTTQPSRAVQTAVLQLRTGVGNLKPYLKVVGKRTNDLCFTCRRRETAEHILLTCPRFVEARKEMQRTLPTSLLSLRVLFNTTKGQQALEKFVVTTGICHRGWKHEES